MTINIIAALANNNVIGKDNKLLWHLPADLKYFKSLTIGKPIIMGRKTYESIGKPLPERKNIIVTRNQNYYADGCYIAESLEKAIKLANDYSECFIIGGGEIYKQALYIADNLYITRVDAFIEGDTFFPEISLSKWQLIDIQKFNSDEKNKYNYSFETYKKK